MKVVVYTACFGGYDEVVDLVNPNPDIEYVYYTDRYPKKKLYGWTVVKQHRITKTPVRDARRRKIRVDRYRRIWDADCSIWIDSNMELLCNPISLCAEFLDGCDWAMFGHPHRRNIVEEARECLRPRYERDKSHIIDAQIKRYGKEGDPRLWGIMSTGVLLRRHTDKVKEFGIAWYKEITNGSHRDQFRHPNRWQLRSHYFQQD